MDFIFGLATIIGAITGVFTISESLLTSQSRKELASYIKSKRFKTLNYEKLPDIFVQIFDNLFSWNKGKPFLFVFKSFLYSWVLFTLILLPVYIKLIIHAFNDEFWVTVLGLPVLIGAGLSFPVFTNLIPDVISIHQSRLVIEKIRQTKKIFLWLILDLFLSFSILGIYLHLCLFFFNLISSIEPPINFNFLISLQKVNYTKILTFEENIFPILITTLLTSIWLWLFAVGAYMAAFVTKFNSIAEKLEFFFVIDDCPLHYIGFISCIVASITMIIWKLVIIMF